MQHVIIGTGPAGVVAAETLRKLAPRAQVTLIGDEPEPPYSRMAIPYYLVDNIGEKGTYLRKRDAWFDKRRIDVISDRVDSIDTAAHSLSLASGGERKYDRLLIATGSSAVKPPIEGVNLPGVYNCWTLADAREIIERARPGARVVLMGAGFIGCIILEALASRGVKLTVIEMEDRMVPRMMNQRSGGLIKRWCENKGVEVLTSTKVNAISGNGDGALSVNLGMGDNRPADLVIAATGVKPNTGFLSGSGIEVDGGVVVDHRLRTSVADVYAAGDVARGKDFSTRSFVVQAIQPTAVEHGRVAATNMVNGMEIVHQGSLNMNVLDTMGLISSSFGHWEGVDGGDAAELFDADRFKYINLQFRDDVLVGANTLGFTQHVGVLRGLIQTQLRLGAAGKRALMDNPLGITEAYLRASQGTTLSL
ncbi:MAG: NAD(P)/FAD-dependent oxidoreductase [Proteobacteria bacterium]|nr:MAG: NAD(P)/FAD-dependent oxidoreductase [Pseudomonadota bacterium]